jgi:hypothetical protein
MGEMRTREPAEAWVVYNVRFAGGRGYSAVCEQAAWDAMARVVQHADGMDRDG